jgi:HEAT repeat protein
LLQAIRDEDPKVRTEAWLSADEVGAPAIGPLAELVTQDDLEVARAAKRGMWHIVRNVGRPGADEVRKAVAADLVQLLEKQPAPVLLREVLWMLSEIGGDEAASAIAPFLDKPDSREDARMALERIPGEKSLALLKTGLEKAPRDHKAPIAQSLRNRGVPISKYPSAKLVPTKPTQVKPLEEGSTQPGEKEKKS